MRNIVRIDSITTHEGEKRRIVSFDQEFGRSEEQDPRGFCLKGRLVITLWNPPKGLSMRLGDRYALDLTPAPKAKKEKKRR